ncbi:hypothetical protein PCASD_06554 [Puccinia coronata f. sp. avenae]|uniref:Uncharacterized protein n=1 Tax=Puccinia coronata f. sp. avenae TaxID=200324 RepID=A0A2N5TFP1_9BASI|nr:hypothetical protein PCASD_06554 [Puccinia coronata f. sp. avenae]
MSVGDYPMESQWSDYGRRFLLKNKESILELASWLCHKFVNALRKRDTAKNELKQLFEKQNPHAEGNIKYSTDFLRAQWVRQAGCKGQRTEEDDIRMKKLAEFFKNEEILKKAKNAVVGAQGQLSSSVNDWDRVLRVFENHEEDQQKLANSLGRNYKELLSATADKEKRLTLLWEAKSELFLQAVELQGEQYPIMGSRTVGTKMQQRILKAIQQRKNPVKKAIKNFNTRRSNYLLAHEPERANKKDNQDLNYKDFLKMDLNNPFWNNSFFFHSGDPWAINSYVRHGIQSMLMLDRVQEEVQLLTHDLDRAMSWAHEILIDLKRAIGQLDTWLASPEILDLSNPENCLAMVLIALPLPSKLQVLRSELQLCLTHHQQLIKHWMCDVDWLWDRTRNRHTKSTHPWFDTMANLRERYHENSINSIDNAMELLGFDSNRPDEVEGVSDEAQQSISNDEHNNST